MQSKCRGRELRERFLRARDRRDLDVLVPISSTMLCRCVSSSSTMSSRFTALVDEAGDARERLVERLLRDRLLEVRERAGLESLLPLVGSRDDVHRDVPRLRMVLQPVEHRPAVHPRHVDVERDRIGLERVRQLESGLAVERARGP